MTSSPSTEWVTFWNQVESGNIKLPFSAVQNLVHHVRRNLTRRINDASPECTTPFLLDDESSYDAPVEILDDCYNNSYAHSNDGSDPSFNSYAGAGRSSSLSIFLKYKKKVGRASIFRSRPEYFAPSDNPLTPEEAEARRKRGEEANYRKAYRAAADEAMASNCLTWVTLTFDDQHRSNDPQKDFERFKRRLRERYKRKTGKSLKYVAIVGFSPTGREHIHSLWSHDVDPDDIRECWRNGHVDEISLIEHEEIEIKVGYMGNHIRDGRVSFGRFLHSRSANDPDELIPVRDIDEGRQVLEDLVYPHHVRVVQSRLFGEFTRVTFRFPPIRDDDECESFDE
jgi:hypothetical protein